MTKIKTVTIESKAIYSDDEKYRYLLERIWDKDNKRAAVIMLNPSKAGELKSDKTVMNVTNYLIDNDFGSISIVNLFAFTATDPVDLKNRNELQEKPNNEYIVSACSSADIIIIAWTYDKKDKVIRKREVERLLKPYKSKLKCFMDNQGRMPRHPRDLSEDWTLVDYKFEFI